MFRFAYIAALIIAGEMIFGLPFHVSRFARPTFLTVFDYSNTQLGDMFAVYGITAAISYFPGGALADRFSARLLLTSSLVATALGGFYLATIPTPVGVAVLYGYWGVTTIFLFWGALIKATRDWGGPAQQGVAFGILDSGRGLAAAVVSMLAVWLLAAYLPQDANLGTVVERRAGLQSVILLYSLVTLGAAGLIWFAIPPGDSSSRARTTLFAGIPAVMRMPHIWAQAGVIACAYCGYKGIDNYSLYAVDVLGMDEVEGARLASYGAYVRPVGALAAGLIADRFKASRSIAVFFAVLACAYAALSWSTLESTGSAVIIANLFVTLFTVFAMRGVYFALLEESQTPQKLTGAAVGVVSFVGFTPEIFFSSIAGRVLDADPGVVGHLNFFRMMALVALLGLAVTAALIRLRPAVRRPSH